MQSKLASHKGNGGGFPCLTAFLSHSRSCLLTTLLWPWMATISGIIDGEYNRWKMFPWGGFSCWLGGAALYWLGHSSGRDADILKSVKRVSQISDLDLLLNTASKVEPLVISVAGRLGSETPIVCERSRIRGVILEEMVEQHFLKHNDAGSSILDCAVMPSKSKEVPWYLEDGTGHVYVVGARGASGLELTVASEVFEESGRSFVLGTLDHLQGLKMVGVKRVERVLPTGTTLTVVGEAVKDNKTIRIQRPYKGPFYVSPEDLDQLIANLGKWARVMEAAAQRLDQKKQESDQSQTGSQHDYNVKRDNHTQDMCVICLEQQYNAVFVPCGHMCCCTSCASYLSSCPLCRRRIQQVVKTYRH